MERLGIVAACCLLAGIAVGCGEDIGASLEKDLIVLTERLNQHAETVEDKVAVRQYTFDRWTAFVPAPPAEDEDGDIAIPEPQASRVLPDDAKIVHWQDKFTLLQSISTRYKLTELEVFPPPRKCRHTRIKKSSGCVKDERLHPVIEPYTAVAKFELRITRHSKAIGTPKPLPKGPKNTRPYVAANAMGLSCAIFDPLTLEEAYETLTSRTVPYSLSSDNLSPEIHAAIQAFRKEAPTVCTEKISIKLRYDDKTKQWFWVQVKIPLTVSQETRTLGWHETLPSEGRQYISQFRLGPKKAK